MSFNRSAIRSTHLNVTRNGQVLKKAVSEMSDGELVSAMGRPDNQQYLADGWQRNGAGQIVRTPTAAAPSGGAGSGTAPPVPAGGQPAPRPGSGTAAPVAAGPGANPWGTFNIQAIKPGVEHVWVTRNGTKQRVHITTLSGPQLQSAMLRPDNRQFLANGWTISGDKIVRGGGGGGGAAPGGAAPGGGVGGGAAPGQSGDHGPPAGVGGAPGGGANPGGGKPGPPSWIPPMIGLNGLTADPRTGRIDWSNLLSRVHGVSAVDPEYAQQLSANIASAMQALAQPQAEIQSLTSVDPTTGKTLYQSYFENALRQHNQQASSSMGNAAMRGIGSSGMVNTTLGAGAAGFQQQSNELQGRYGNKRITDLLKQMTGTLAEQDNNFLGSYYSALSRANQGIPSIPGVG